MFCEPRDAGHYRQIARKLWSHLPQKGYDFLKTLLCLGIAVLWCRRYDDFSPPKQVRV